MLRSVRERAAAAAGVIRALDQPALDYFLYASGDELRLAAGCAERVVVGRGTEDPFGALRRLRLNRDRTLYGYLGFDLCSCYVPYRAATAGPLAALVVPQLEVRWRRDGVRVRGDRALARSARVALAAGGSARVPSPAPGAAPGGGDERAFRRRVATVIDAVRRGKLAKAIVSRRVERTGRLDVLGTWQRLVTVAPAARWFAFRLGETAGVGASPELLLESNGRGRVATNPLAGTRPRGADRRQDDRLRAELLDDPKELREHLMSVDVAVDELSSVCRPGTVEPSEFMEVRRYRRVQHLSSRIEGRLRPGKTVWDALRAVFPGVTVSGIPKAAAVRLIGELEPEPRGIYGGAVGWIDGAGRSDLALAIRAAFEVGGRTFVQSGAGILDGSRPAAEYEESRQKLRTILDALRLAQRG